MTTDPTEARLRFLKEAAYQLATSAPIISASISSVYVNSALDTEDIQQAGKEWNTLRRELCGACGNILLPGWSSATAHQSRAVAKRGRSTGKPKRSEKQIVQTCLRCYRKSIQTIQPRPPKHINRKVKHAIAVVPEPELALKQTKEEPPKAIKTANSTSKQRSKSRKGGLLAMLEKNKSQSSGAGGMGLDLMDFGM